jgi:hypothetical protein
MLVLWDVHETEKGCAHSEARALGLMKICHFSCIAEKSFGNKSVAEAGDEKVREKRGIARALNVDALSVRVG